MSLSSFYMKCPCSFQMRDLLLFLVILSLAVMAFGVINQVMLNHKAPLDLELLNKVLYRPYFQMYGELFLEDYEHTGKCMSILVTIMRLQIGRSK